MLSQFRRLYPQGSMISELIEIDRGTYLVRVSITIDGITLATGLAGADTIETAEDMARNRALKILMPENGQPSHNLETKTPKKIVEISSTPLPKTITPPSSKTVSLPNSQLEIVSPIDHQPEIISSVEPEYSGSLFETETELEPPEEDYPEEESENTAADIELDFNQIRHKIDLEMKRLSWTKEQGRDYLLSTYGKRSRLHLTDDELLEFWRYLEALPN